MQDRPDELVFAEAQSGDRFAIDDIGRVCATTRTPRSARSRARTFEHWLDATVAREQILFGPDGEYAPDVFESEGEEVVPTIALRQAERALKVDPGAAEAHHARGLALARLGRRQPALAAFAAAAELDARQSVARGSISVARRWSSSLPAGAAGVSAGGGPRSKRPTGAGLLAWGVRAAAAAGDEASAAALRSEALARDPRLVDGLVRAAASAAAEGEEEGSAEELALLEAVAPGTPVPRRLPVIPHSRGPLPRPSRPSQGLPSPRPSRPSQGVWGQDIGYREGTGHRLQVLGSVREFGFGKLVEGD